MTTTVRATIDAVRLDALPGRFVGDLGVTAAAANVVIGERLGLHRGMAAGPAISAELAARTGIAERVWLSGQAAGGDVDRHLVVDLVHRVRP